VQCALPSAGVCQTPADENSTLLRSMNAQEKWPASVQVLTRTTV